MKKTTKTEENFGYQSRVLNFECLLGERVESRAGWMIMMPTTKLVVAVTESLGLSNLTLPGEFPHVWDMSRHVSGKISIFPSTLSGRDSVIQCVRRWSIWPQPEASVKNSILLKILTSKLFDATCNFDHEFKEFYSSIFTFNSISEHLCAWYLSIKFMCQILFVSKIMCQFLRRTMLPH